MFFSKYLSCVSFLILLFLTGCATTYTPFATTYIHIPENTPSFNRLLLANEPILLLASTKIQVAADYQKTLKNAFSDNKAVMNHILLGLEKRLKVYPALKKVTVDLEHHPDQLDIEFFSPQKNRFIFYVKNLIIRKNVSMTSPAGAGMGMSGFGASVNMECDAFYMVEIWDIAKQKKVFEFMSEGKQTDALLNHPLVDVMQRLNHHTVQYIIKGTTKF